MKSTIQRLELYAESLRKWKRLKFSFDNNIKNKIINKKPLPSEPMPDVFGFSRTDEYCLKIRESVIGKQIPKRRT